jgi:hypothetical protein
MQYKSKALICSGKRKQKYGRSSQANHNVGSATKTEANPKIGRSGARTLFVFAGELLASNTYIDIDIYVCVCSKGCIDNKKTYQVKGISQRRYFTKGGMKGLFSRQVDAML